MDVIHVDNIIGESTDSDGETSSSSTQTIFNCLRSPLSLELGRKRKVDRNPPRRSRGLGANDPKSITPQQRVATFSGEYLTVSNNKLFCSACREELSVKSSVLRMHLQSAKHKSSKDRLHRKSQTEKDIAEALKTSDYTLNSKGETLPEEQRVYRVKVVRTFLQSGVPLSKISEFRELLEENALRLTDRRHMSDFILEQEQLKVKEEITQKPLAITFDGTSRLGEAFCVVVRFIDSEWSIQERLIRFELLANGEEIAHQLISVLSLLIAAMRDCASSNNVAMRTLKVVYPFLLDIGCFAHTLDRVGERFKIPLVNDFTTYWVSLFSHSFKAKLLWKERTGRPVCGYSSTRWWSRWEVMNQLLELFGDLHPFLNSTDEFSSSTRTKLLGILTNPQTCIILKVELAAVIDAGKPFVQGTYNLEGKGPLALQCYEIISSVTAAVEMAHYPNVEAVISSITNHRYYTNRIGNKIT